MLISKYNLEYYLALILKSFYLSSFDIAKRLFSKGFVPCSQKTIIAMFAVSLTIFSTL